MTLSGELLWSTLVKHIPEPRPACHDSSVPLCCPSMPTGSGKGMRKTERARQREREGGRGGHQQKNQWWGWEERRKRDAHAEKQKRATKTRAHCGWDSPTRPNHSVSCWSLHACTPSPLRQSCNTEERSDSDACPMCSHHIRIQCINCDIVHTQVAVAASVFLQSLYHNIHSIVLLENTCLYLCVSHHSSHSNSTWLQGNACKEGICTTR